jgi:acyl-CoA reductase-like NAD-dependent aldehyde dehydrogenase
MATNIKSYPNLINGTWKTSSDTRLEDRNPADYNEMIGLFPRAPFGGFKQSSANTFKGQAAMHFYTRTKTIYNHG